MAAPDHLSPMQFYHGTKYTFEAGQELTATGAKQADSSYPEHIQHVWATTKPLAAATHAIKHGKEYWDSGRVYQFTSLRSDDVELDPLDNGNKSSYRSPSGFRVVKNMGSSSKLWNSEAGDER